MSIFTEDLFEKGIKQRVSTVGEDYVKKNLEEADEFSRPFQEAMTAWCWVLVGAMKQLTQKHDQ